MGVLREWHLSASARALGCLFASFPWHILEPCAQCCCERSVNAVCSAEPESPLTLGLEARRTCHSLKTETLTALRDYFIYLAMFYRAYVEDPEHHGVHRAE
jgi:hypothetical protein